jgi:photosystem II stability/assembly factor-like uncharacterized protein
VEGSLTKSSGVSEMIKGIEEANTGLSSNVQATSLQYNWRNVKIVGGGYVVATIFNPSEKDLIYAKTDMGGVYRWDPPSNSWIPLTDWVSFDDWNLLGCESIATDPINTNRLYVAAGSYTNSWTSMNGAILRSFNKGKTWETIMLPFKLGGNMAGRSMGERLQIDPNDNNILYLGTRSGNGLWKSIDAGITWNKVNSFTAVGNFSDSYFQDIIGVVWEIFDPTSGSAGSPSKIIYVGVADTTSSIYRSTDGGATWQALSGQPVNGYFPQHGVLSSNGILYITYSNGVGPYDGTKGDVWKYDTKSGVWTNISPIPSSSSSNYWGYGGIAVDAQKPNTIMVTTLNEWWPDANIYRSTDGGETWSPIWHIGNYPERINGYTQDISIAPWLDWGTTKNLPEVTPKLGWMVGDIKIDPFNSDRMMYGTGATLYGTNNLTAWDNGNNVNISVMASGIEETSINVLVSPPSGASLLSGINDVSGFYHKNVNVVPSRMMTTPTFDATSIDYAENNQNFVVRVGNGNAANGIKSLAISYDGGIDWNPDGNDVSGLTGGGSVAVSSDGKIILWSPTGAKVSYSTDTGNSWIASNGIPSGAIVASDRVNANKFYGFNLGNFYVSTDGGANFKNTVTTGLPNSSVNFKAVLNIEGDIWLAGGSVSDTYYGLWHSTDSGASFTQLSNVQEADIIGFGKPATGQTYMALYTSAKINNIRGIFRSDDEGENWIRINDDNHQYGCTNSTITGDPRIYGRVYIGTNGRGIIYGDITAQ